MTTLKVLKMLVALSSVNGKIIEDSIKALEQLFVSLQTPLSVNAFACWETGENFEASSKVFNR